MGKRAWQKAHVQMTKVTPPKLTLYNISPKSYRGDVDITAVDIAFKINKSYHWKFQKWALTTPPTNDRSHLLVPAHIKLNWIVSCSLLRSLRRIHRVLYRRGREATNRSVWRHRSGFVWHTSSSSWDALPPPTEPAEMIITFDFILQHVRDAVHRHSKKLVFRREMQH